MLTTRRMAIVAFVSLASATATLAGPTARELEQKALDYRKALKPGRVVVKVSDRVNRNAPEYEKFFRIFDQIYEAHPGFQAAMSGRSREG